ncbi:exodeoxyribonuclease V subunit gamma, partial [Klebsiella pneumoniae]|nr:exodeoxyribonuclease V subunit gamma [Klebsiella pneumoniae]
MESEDWCAVLIDNIDNFFKTLDDKIEKEQQQLKASRMKTELETKLAQETKVHNELSERLAELSRRSGELDNVCASLQSCLTIADS